MTRSAGFRLTAVSVRYGDERALDRVDLTIAPGEAVALVGPSGAGKTTLLTLLNGTHSASAGSVAVDGEPLDGLTGRRLRALRARIGFIPQDLGLVPNLRVIHNIIAGRLGRMSFFHSLRAMTLPRRADVRAAFALLARVGIEDKLYARTDSLSGGQRQRVAVARALFQEPQALLADEPVSSVDPARARDLIALLLELSRERGLTLCASMHDIELAREFFPRLVGLRHGCVQFDAPPGKVSRQQLAALYELSPEELASGG